MTPTVKLDDRPEDSSLNCFSSDCGDCGDCFGCNLLRREAEQNASIRMANSTQICHELLRALLTKEAWEQQGAAADLCPFCDEPNCTCMDGSGCWDDEDFAGV